MARIYLDHAATTPAAPEVRAAVAECMAEGFGNPLSLHGIGVEAARAVERARRAVRSLLGERFRRVVFTSGGTEANNLAVLGLGRPRRGRRIVATTVEHSSIRAAIDAARALGAEVDLAPVGPAAEVDVERFVSAALGASFAALHLVHNELGTIADVTAVSAELARRSPETLLHVDAVAALGKLDLRAALGGASSVSISAHKAYGPRGVGALGLADGADPLPMLLGGGHEGGVRAGTQNVEGIVGFGVAAGLAAECTAPGANVPSGFAARVRGGPGGGEARSAEQPPGWMTARLAALDRRLLDGIAPLAPTLVPLVPPDRRVPGLVALAVRGMPAEVLLHRLEARGVYCSAGSACSSRLARSPVLDAIGAPPEVGMIRVSMGRSTSEADVDGFVEAVGAAIREGGA